MSFLRNPAAELRGILSIKIDNTLSPRESLTNIANKPKTINELMKDPNIRHTLKQTGIEDPINAELGYLNSKSGEWETRKGYTAEEIIDIAQENNPNSFDLNKPPIDDPEQMLSWLKWRNAGHLVYDDITPDMIPKALSVASQLGLPIEELSWTQINVFQDMTDQELQQRLQKIENPEPDFMDKILNTPGILSDDEMRIINRNAHDFRWSKKHEDPMYEPTDLIEYREQLSSEIGEHFDAHGMAKGSELRVLNYLLSHGINPDRTFYTCPLKSEYEVAAAAAFGAAGPYDTGAFIVLGQPDKQISDSGIKTVLVNEHYYNTIPTLTNKFPEVNFVRADQMEDALKTILEKSKAVKK